MRSAPNVSPAIIDTLYEEALCLTEAARAEFDMASNTQEAVWAVSDLGQPAVGTDARTRARVALSSEALRTTTRMMHAMAWLLNHKAYFRGDLSAFELHRTGRLPSPQKAASAAEREALSEHAKLVVDATCAFYNRLTRLDEAFQRRAEPQPPEIERLYSRIDRAFAAH